MFDIIIIGAGPSGMTAALYALRAGKSVLILEKDHIGGQIANSPRVENYPSINEISGLDLANKMFEQIVNLGVNFDLEEVISLTKDEKIFHVKTNYSSYEAKSVIIATGVSHRKLNIPGEEEFNGKGVSYCAVCDGAFYKGEDVVVIGDANTALQYSLLLSNYCKSVTICTLFDKFFAEKILVDRLKERNNIAIYHNLSVVEIKGEEEVNEVIFKNTLTEKKESFKTKAVFIAIGQIPHNENFKNLANLDEHGFIKVDSHMETNVKGLFAVGDCTQKEVRQVVTADNDGAIASVYAVNYIDSLK